MQVRVNGLIKRMHHPWAPFPMRQPRTAAQFSNAPWELRHHAPLLGEHTAEVLRDAGMSEARVAALFDEGVAKAVDGVKPSADRAKKRDSRLNSVQSG